MTCDLCECKYIMRYIFVNACVNICFFENSVSWLIAILPGVGWPRCFCPNFPRKSCKPWMESNWLHIRHWPWLESRNACSQCFFDIHVEFQWITDCFTIPLRFRSIWWVCWYATFNCLRNCFWSPSRTCEWLGFGTKDQQKLSVFNWNRILS